MSKDIALIYTYRLTEVNEMLNQIPPLGIHSISAYVKQMGYSAEVVVSSSDALMDKLVELAKETKVIGFSCYEDNYRIIYNAIKYIKKRFNCKLFVGGPQAYNLQEEFIEKTGCDAIIRGDGEIVVTKLLDYYIHSRGKLEDIKGITYFNGTKVVNNGIAPMIENLDELPFLDVDYSKNYNNTAYIISGRGCPFSCAFCFDGANSRSVRLRSIPNVTKEIKMILDKYPNVTTIQFLDDTFTLNVERVKQICDFFLEVRKERKVKWICEAHVNLLHRNLEMVDMMVKAGLCSIQIGLESGNDNVLAAYNKNTTKEKIISVVKYCKEHGLNNMQGNIIVGGALESEATINDNAYLIKKIMEYGRGMFELYTTYFWPFPNTAMTNNPDQYELKILESEVDKAILSMRSPVTESKTMSLKQIVYARKRLDMVLVASCREACLQMKINEIEKHWDFKRKTFVGFWGGFLKQFEYMTNFMLAKPNAIECVEQYELSEIFPIRTFFALQYKNEELCKDNTVFTNTQRIIIENANGKKSLEEIVNEYCLAEESIVQECYKLREKLYIYFSLC